MPRPPGRAAAEAHYRQLRELAFQQATDDLAAAGLQVTLRAIDAGALAAFANWHGRRVDWP
jgi:hypothetical protein